MRLRRSRLEGFFHKKMTVKKDKEGSTSEEYGAASSVTGESWPASGKVQAEQYGQRLNYIRNIRIQGSYKIQTDEKGRLHYILEDGTDMEERDGICLYVAADQLPDYRIISIKPYRFLTMEVEKKALQEVSELDTRQAVGEAIQFVRSAAVENCHADTGELRQSIFAETAEEENTVTGICWTDKAYAPYIEFGTGPKGQEKHAGISPEVTPVYTQQPWWIHESQIDRRVAEKYRWPYIDTPDGRFYRCSGNPAYPFLYPAMKDNEEQILKMLGGSLASDLEDI